MPEKKIKTSGAGEIQVVELRMDNTEDQDELNRRLRKPGEPGYVAPPKVGESTASPAAGANGETATKPGKEGP
jgi:hypothetical protein